MATGVGNPAAAIADATRFGEVRARLFFLIGALIVQAVLSWINPFHPLAGLLARLTSPVLRPLQCHIPPIAGIDLSPLIVLLGLQVLVLAPIAWLDWRLEQLLIFGA